MSRPILLLIVIVLLLIGGAVFLSTRASEVPTKQIEVDVSRDAASN